MLRKIFTAECAEHCRLCATREITTRNEALSPYCSLQKGLDRLLAAVRRALLFQLRYFLAVQNPLKAPNISRQALKPVSPFTNVLRMRSLNDRPRPDRCSPPSDWNETRVKDHGLKMYFYKAEWPNISASEHFEFTLQPVRGGRYPVEGAYLEQ